MASATKARETVKAGWSTAGSGASPSSSVAKRSAPSSPTRQTIWSGEIAASTAEAGSGAPAVEIGLGCQRDALHPNSSSCFHRRERRLEVGCLCQPTRCQSAQGDERHDLFHGMAEPREVFEAQSAPAARTQDLGHSLGAKPRHAQQVLAVGRVDVDGKPVAIGECPGGLGVDGEVEHAAHVGAGDLLHTETVKAQQPVRLIEPVLAHQRRLDQRQGCGWHRGMGEKAE